MKAWNMVTGILNWPEIYPTAVPLAVDAQSVYWRTAFRVDQWPRCGYSLYRGGDNYLTNIWEKSMRLVIWVVFAFIVSFPTYVLAEESVTIDGITWTCTNSCNVTLHDDGYSVEDCCGGQVSVELY